MPSLHDVTAARRDPELVVLEGFHALKHAVRFGGDVLGVWTADGPALEALRERLAPDLALPPVTLVEHEELTRVVPRAQVLALARRPVQPDARALLALPGPEPVILLEAPRHLGNLGACVRVAAAAGAAGVISTGDQDPWHADALRGGAGLHFALPVRRVRELPPTDRALIALDPEGDVLGATGTPAIPPRAVLAFGTERDGLSDALLARADARLALPMRPGVSSLNLATSVAAVLYGLPSRT
ncbi:23S rRNA (adenosine(1067)-2'-O)-methyltransferase [Paraconexibacter sp. AEG42_29]|uniref:23S rRNA (Adenosine(1067)-2'-O)-methyltransferase n=1 Tax=Paraconexibacter sp. AEG42_29 TaxID=2997339 RepID=A0AAU7B2N1_9ACTN